MQKRILRELTKIFPDCVKNNKTDYIVYINESSGHKQNVINNLTIFSKYYNCKILIHLNDSYPFHPPKIYFDNNKSISYNYWSYKILKNKNNYNIFISYIFSCIYMKTLDGIKKSLPDNQTCLCCESLYCSNKWSPSITLFMLFNECVFRKNLEKFLLPIYQLYFIKIFKNERWNIPDDILLHIINFYY